MRLDINEELTELANVVMTHGVTQEVQGAAWALGRVTGQGAPEILAAIDHRARMQQPQPTASVLPQAPPAPGMTQTQLVVSPPVEMAPPTDPVIGLYPVPGHAPFPVTKWGDQPKAADMTKPPAPPSDDSFAAMNERMIEEGNPALLPLDDETMAEVEAEMEQARAIARGEILAPAIE